MGFKIFVGNLSYDATEEGLKDLFAAYGTVESVRIITDRDTGKSRGFAFVEMANQGECQNAVKAMDGYRHLNRNLRVNEAQPQAARPRAGGGGLRTFDRGPAPAPGGGGGGVSASPDASRNFGPDKEKRRAGAWKAKKPGKRMTTDEPGGGKKNRWDSMDDDK